MGKAGQGSVLGLRWHRAWRSILDTEIAEKAVLTLLVSYLNCNVKVVRNGFH